MARVRWIAYSWIDPWTREFCAGATLAYSPERMLKGFYRKHIMRTKKIAQQFTGPRKPKLVLVIKRGFNT